jgi:GH25 family lysozyme M1 (1,4-beta-N-acetylmuramidase)
MSEITDRHPFYQFFSKILEKFMYNRLKSFINKHNILSEAQNGFRKMKSTETASQTFIENIQQAVDQCLHVVDYFESYRSIQCSKP